MGVGLGATFKDQSVMWFEGKGMKQCWAQWLHCREMDGRGESPGWSFPPSPPPPFQELQLLWFAVLLWQMQNQNRSSVRYGVSKQSHLLSGNQWLSTLMEVLVFLVLLITNKSRIRKSVCSQCRWRFRSGLLGEVLLLTFLTVSAAPGSAESGPQITCELPGGLWTECL